MRWNFGQRLHRHHRLELRVTAALAFPVLGCRQVVPESVDGCLDAR